MAAALVRVYILCDHSYFLFRDNYFHDARMNVFAFYSSSLCSCQFLLCLNLSSLPLYSSPSLCVLKLISFFSDETKPSIKSQIHTLIKRIYTRRFSRDEQVEFVVRCHEMRCQACLIVTLERHFQRARLLSLQCCTRLFGFCRYCVRTDRHASHR